MHSIIIPLVKCKGGDLADVNNYRAITLSNSVTKLFESVISNKLGVLGMTLNCIHTE